MPRFVEVEVVGGPRDGEFVAVDYEDGWVQIGDWNVPVVHFQGRDVLWWEAREPI